MSVVDRTFWSGSAILHCGFNTYLFNKEKCQVEFSSIFKILFIKAASFV